jgi:glycosyltransferase involved in cell wall biosynthesis
VTEQASPKVSIVTPLRNNADDLRECLHSILSQTYQNWDCVVVDNCSTDASADIAARFAATDPRIRVLRNAEVLPAIANHNYAVQQVAADSKYCKVVFADDWIYPECLERMVAVAESNDRIGIVGSYVLEGNKVTCAGLPYDAHVFSGREICRKHFLDRVYVFGSANSLLYRAELVRNNFPFFNEANIHADNEACFSLLRYWDFGFVHQVLTYTRIREGSLNTRSVRLQTSMADWLAMLLKYGPDFLTAQEATRCIDQHLAEYYRYLGRNLLRRRDAEFWTYHRTKLSELGYPLSRIRLGSNAIAGMLDLALNPKSTLERIFARRLPPGSATAQSREGRVMSIFKN